MRENRPYTYLGTVRGMCRECRSLVPCRILEEGGKVYQERICPTCAPSRALIAEDVAWYSKAVKSAVHCKPPAIPGTNVRKGCPWDCGPCQFHANACHLPVFSVTNVCNMNCPICFTYNRPDVPYHMTREELRSILDGVVERAGPVDLVNITGGEPLLHPKIVSLIEECKRPEIGRVTVNSNGCVLAENEALCRQLADLGVYVILSFDTLRPATSMTIHGRDVVAIKRKALENLQRFAIGTTLLNVMIRGVNEDEIGAIIDLAGAYSVVRSVTVQNMTFTGQGGKAFEPRQHLPLDGAARAIEEGTKGSMRREHFFPHPAAHPLCYSVAYFLKTDGGYRSFTDFLQVDQLREMLAGGYLLRPTETVFEQLKGALDRLWAEGADETLLRELKGLLTRMYPPGKALPHFERQRIAEESILTVYIHAHMDEDTMDLGRLVACPDQVPDADGRMVPACSYNVFYRTQDERFYVNEADEHGRHQPA